MYRPSKEQRELVDHLFFVGATTGRISDHRGLSIYLKRLFRSVVWCMSWIYADFKGDSEWGVTMIAFQEYRAVEKLKELARSPIDLTKGGGLTPKRIEQLTATHLGLKLLYATERVSEEVIEALFELAEEAKAVDKTVSHAEIPLFISTFTDRAGVRLKS